MNSLCLAMIALAPMLLGPLPEERRTITANLCGGGSIEIPLDREEPQGDCHPKACHAGSCRAKSKKAN